MLRLRKNKLKLVILVLVLSLLSLIINYYNKSWQSGDAQFQDSFIYGEHLYRYNSGKKIFWNGKYLFLEQGLYKYSRSNEYIKDEFPSELTKLLYFGEKKNYDFFSQFGQSVMWILHDGTIIIYDFQYNRIHQLDINETNFVSPAIKDNYLYFYQQDLCRLNIIENKIDVIDTSSFKPYHSFVITNENNIFYHSPDYSGELNKQYDILINLENGVQYKNNSAKNNKTVIDACDNDNMYYTVFDSDYYFYKSSKDNLIQIGFTPVFIEDVDSPFTFQYNKYVGDTKIIAVPSVSGEGRNVSYRETFPDNELRYYVLSHDGLIEKEEQISLYQFEELVYHCFDDNILYLFIHNTMNDTIRIIVTSFKD